MVHDRRVDCHHAENDLNEELGCLRELVGDTAAATSALSCDTNDKDSNEPKYLQEALHLVDGLLGEESHDDYEFVTAENSHSPTDTHTDTQTHTPSHLRSSVFAFVCPRCQTALDLHRASSFLVGL